MIPPTLAALAVPVDSLVPWSRNPRRGDVDVIIESLEHNGQYRPIVVRTSTREVLAGNHTLEAARRLGWPEIAATFVDVDDDQAARIVLVDNRANDLAGYDAPTLADILDSLPDLTGTGFDAADLTPPTGDDWSSAMGGLSTEEPTHRTRTFTIHADDLPDIDAAITTAIAGDTEAGANGRALAAICRSYLARHDG